MTSKFKQIEDLAKEFMQYNELNGAFRLYQELEKFLATIKTSDPDFPAYQNLLKKLKVFTINFFEEDDYFNLIKNDLEIIFEIPDYDFWEKIKLLLIMEYDFNQRDALKEKFKRALFDCKRPLINSNNYQNQDLPLTVADWLKDFIVNLGVEKIDSIKKQEYLTNGKFLKLLKKDDQEKIRSLFKLYEKLNQPSTQREGMENSVPVEMDGQYFILDQGDIVELDDSLKEISKISNKIDMAASSDTVLTEKTVSPPIPNRQSELEQALKKYPPDSLEYKAIKQEIEHFNKPVKKSPKLDVKK